ncbi:hypothetical protein EC845_1679 [Comamonas sp. BIGb0124]|uniref:hypothetical protein n=1 Tax=Comamonas sp. BIGb0124 TaxID=2485130 RepID=UPI000F46B2CC|nr:hypothetical protein [Comamonas sp. BIGb0124]ROR22773.1 hypothetical protein EC845_1679 [Comamonas sp. BIGb0124]
MRDDLMAEISATAARLVVEEGLEYGPAKRRALKQLKLPARTALPDNDQLEAEVREYLAVFCGETQPDELRALRGLALEWMNRLADFRPYLSGAVWTGTATRLSDIYLQLFCDDPKSAEIELINRDVRYDVASIPGFQGQTVDVLSIGVRGEASGVLAGETVMVHLVIYDLDDLRGALKADPQGRVPRGDARAVARLLEARAAD